MAPKRSGIKIRLLASACCFRPVKSQINKVCCLLGKPVRLQTGAIVFGETACHRLQSTADWQPASRGKPEIFHHFSPHIYLTESSETVGPEISARLSGALPAQGLCKSVTGINQSINHSINPPTVAAQRCSSETWNLVIVTGASHGEKPTIQPSFFPIMSGLSAGERGRRTDSTA